MLFVPPLDDKSHRWNAYTPEVESDRATAIYAESDGLPSTEVLEDPGEGPDDPMAGDPNLSADRGPDEFE